MPSVSFFITLISPPGTETPYRTWILAITYGYSFGVELTVDNIIVSYLYDQFNMSLITAGEPGSAYSVNIS